MIQRLRNFLTNKDSFENIRITGRDGDDATIVLNHNFLIKKITLEAKVNEGQVFDDVDVFKQLIFEISKLNAKV